MSAYRSFLHRLCGGYVRAAEVADSDRQRGRELMSWLGDHLFWVPGKGWISMAGLPAPGREAGNDQGAFDDLEQQRILMLAAERIKGDIVDTVRINAKRLGRDRHWRVIEGASENGPHGGVVAAICQNQLAGQITGDGQQRHIHQLGNRQFRFKIWGIHKGVSSLMARIKAAFGWASQ